MLDDFRAGMALVSLRGLVSRQMFCPTCRAVLDCRRAVEITAMRGEGDAGKVAEVYVTCGKCWDTVDRAALDSKAESMGLRLEVTDGRAASDEDWARADMMWSM